MTSPKPLLAWSQDHLLAHRSGYQVLADYLQADRVVTERVDPANGIPLLATRLLRRLAFSRWHTGGSTAMELEVWRRCQLNPPSLVHLLWCDRDLGFLDRVLNLKQTPLIGTFHQCPDEWDQIIRRPSSLRKFAAIILMSETQRNYLLAHGASPDRLHVIPHGVDVDYFTPAAEAPASDSFGVLAVGSTRRNFSLMRAVAEELAGTSRIHFDLVIPPDRHHWFAGLPNVRCHHRVRDDHLLAMYRQASCFMHLVENATANNALLEALACGTPVVGQRSGGVPEYVSAECAILCPPDDGSAVTAALSTLAASRTRQLEMRHAARAHALTLDWQITADQTQQLYSFCA